MKPPIAELLKKNKQDVARALQHFKYSLAKVTRLDLMREDWSEEELESLESFSSRFARTSDLVVSRLLRSLALSEDPAFRGTLIDLLNLAEKRGWISSSMTWLRIRELRNVAAHEYSSDEFGQLLREIARLAPALLEAENLI